MILFQKEEPTESEEEADKLTGVEARFLRCGKEKVGEPLHRTKKLRSWPSEANRKELYMEAMVQETGRPPERSILEAWKEKKAEELWGTITEQISPEESNRILYEHALCHIAKIIANTIHLEKMYTTLRPIGLKQWELASRGLRSLAEENALSALIETKTPQTKEKIPDWIKGAILYLSLLGSKRGIPDLKNQVDTIPEMNALKQAAQWCLGGHMKIGGEMQTLEETTKLFEGWQLKRAKIDLKLVQLQPKDIPKESAVDDPKDLEENQLPWNLTWAILPITEEEIRELGTRVLTNESALMALGKSFKKKTMDRMMSALAKRAYMRAFEESQGIGDRWRTKTLILNPIDDYIDSRIPGKTPLRLTAKSEAAWTLLTEELPEPEF